MVRLQTQRTSERAGLGDVSIASAAVSFFFLGRRTSSVFAAVIDGGGSGDHHMIFDVVALLHRSFRTWPRRDAKRRRAPRRTCWKRRCCRTKPSARSRGMRIPASRCRRRGPSGSTSERERGDFFFFPFRRAVNPDATVHPNLIAVALVKRYCEKCRCRIDPTSISPLLISLC